MMSPSFATITCPACDHAAQERILEDSCMYFWECPSCGVVLRPKPGDCCVFCSYGTERCLPARRASE
jgi:hypothetical protein